jgi:hypothetical protein
MECFIWIVVHGDCPYLRAVTILSMQLRHISETAVLSPSWIVYSFGFEQHIKFEVEECRKAILTDFDLFAVDCTVDVPFLDKCRRN